jgi:hypothetical protein
MNRKAELEILIDSLRLQIQKKYKETNCVDAITFVTLYSNVKSLQDQLEKYIVELKALP